jgi:hypothetical protein
MKETVDKSGIKFSQAVIIIFTSVAFVFDLPWLLAITGLVMIAGSIIPEAGLFRIIYLNVIKPLGLMKPVLAEESSSPHLFSHGMGGVFLVTAFLFIELLPGNSGPAAGWTIAIIVAVLAFINVAFNFCAGCFIYFQLQKSGLFISKRKTHA